MTAQKENAPGSAARLCQAPAQTEVDKPVCHENGRAGALARIKSAERARRRNPKPYVTTPDHEVFLARLLVDEPGFGTGSQCSRLLRATERGVTFFECALLDILSPSVRFSELRKAGYEFDQEWVQQAGPSGRVHTVCRYVRRRHDG